MPTTERHSISSEDSEQHDPQIINRARHFRESRPWRNASIRERNEYPLCKGPYHGEALEPTREVHHIYPLESRWDLRLHPANRIPLCNRCHAKITEMQSKGQDIIAPFQEWIRYREKKFGRMLDPKGGMQD